MCLSLSLSLSLCLTVCVAFTCYFDIGAYHLKASNNIVSHHQKYPPASEICRQMETFDRILSGICVIARTATNLIASIYLTNFVLCDDNNIVVLVYLYTKSKLIL